MKLGYNARIVARYPIVEWMKSCANLNGPLSAELGRKCSSMKYRISYLPKTLMDHILCLLYIDRPDEYDLSAVRYGKITLIAVFKGPTWGLSGPTRAQVDPMNFAIWVSFTIFTIVHTKHTISQRAFTRQKIVNWYIWIIICNNGLKLVKYG